MLIIDCYNVLHVSMPPALAGLDAAGLCRALARTAWRYQGAVVVCDGQPGPLGLLGSPTDEVELIYSGPARTADDVIIDLVEANSAPRRLIVVSSDHEIRRAAKRRRAEVWTSEHFIHSLLAALHHAPPPGPPDAKPAAEGLPGSEVRRWLEAFGLDAGDADEPDAPSPDESEDDETRYWPPW